MITSATDRMLIMCVVASVRTTAALSVRTVDVLSESCRGWTCPSLSNTWTTTSSRCGNWDAHVHPPHWRYILPTIPSNIFCLNPSSLTCTIYWNEHGRTGTADSWNVVAGENATTNPMMRPTAPTEWNRKGLNGICPTSCWSWMKKLNATSPLIGVFPTSRKCWKRNDEKMIMKRLILKKSTETSIAWKTTNSFRSQAGRTPVTCSTSQGGRGDGARGNNLYIIKRGLPLDLHGPRLCEK